MYPHSLLNLPRPRSARRDSREGGAYLPRGLRRQNRPPVLGKFPSRRSPPWLTQEATPVEGATKIGNARGVSQRVSLETYWVVTGARYCPQWASGVERSYWEESVARYQSSSSPSPSTTR